MKKIVLNEKVIPHAYIGDPEPEEPFAEDKELAIKSEVYLSECGASVLVFLDDINEVLKDYSFYCEVRFMDTWVLDSGENCLCQMRLVPKDGPIEGLPAEAASWSPIMTHLACIQAITMGVAFLTVGRIKVDGHA